MHAVVLVAQQGRQQIRDHGARAGLDFDSYGHPGREIGNRVIGQDLRLIERDASGLDELLASGLAAFVVRPFRFFVVLVLRVVANDRVLRYAYDAPTK